MQNQHSLLTGSTQASVGPEIEYQRIFCFLCQPTGSKHYARLGDLTRHIKTVHGWPSRFLCHIDRCPRSIPASGFGRKDKLVAHLESSVPGHKLSHQDAVYQAALHNTSHVQAVSQSSPPSACNDASGNSSAPHGVSQEEYVHNAGLNDRPYMSTAYSHVPHNMMYPGADPAGWHDASGHSNLGMHNGPFEQTPDHSSSMYMVRQGTPSQSVFDDMSTQQTTHPSAFDNVFDENPVDASPMHSTAQSYTDNYGHHHPAWH